MVVLAAVADEAMNALPPSGRAILETVGSAVIRHIFFRESWAVIGVKGAASGSVPEDHGKSLALTTVDDDKCLDPNNKDVHSTYTARPTRKLAQTFYSGSIGEQLTQSMQLRSNDAAWHRAEQEIEGLEFSVESISSCSTLTDKSLTWGVHWWVDGKEVKSPTRISRGLNFMTRQAVTLKDGCAIDGLGCKAFDTYANTNNATGKMYDWINALPDGPVLVFWTEVFTPRW
jgi:hypothetical protein